MDPIASFSGLSSGMDWKTMVDSIIQVESRVMYRYGDRIQDIEAEQAAWNEFRSRVQGLESTAAELGDGSAFKVFQASFSNGSISVTAGEDALPGSLSPRGLQLAPAAKGGGDVF